MPEIPKMFYSRAKHVNCTQAVVYCQQKYR